MGKQPRRRLRSPDGGDAVDLRTAGRVSDARLGLHAYSHLHLRL